PRPRGADRDRAREGLTMGLMAQQGSGEAPHPHMEWGRQMAFVNHFYFYIWDAEWGGTFWKTNAYAPYPIWLWLNGHEWAKRQCEKQGIRYEALDNGFRGEPRTRLKDLEELLNTGLAYSMAPGMAELRHSTSSASTASASAMACFKRRLGRAW